MGRLLFYQGLHRLLRITLWLLGSITATVILLVSILVISLSSGPVPIDFAIPYIEQQLQNEEQSMSLSLDQAYLAWVSDSKKLVVKASGIKLKDINSDVALIDVPDFELRYRLPSLLKLMFVPNEIAIINPRLKIFQTDDGSFTFSKSPQPLSDTFSWISYLPRESGQTPLKTLRHFIIKGLTLEVENISSGETWLIPQADILLNRRQSSIELDISFDVKGAKVTAKATAELLKHEEGFSGMNLKFNGLLENFAFDDLDKFWFATFAAKPRKWIVENLGKAHITKANLSMGLQLDFSSAHPKLNLNNLDGKIAFTGMDVNYLDQMPHVTNVNGVATYNKHQFIIDITSGQLKDVNVRKGKIIIEDLDQKDQIIDINLSIKGPVKTGLGILNQKPLELTKKLGINVRDIEGDAVADLHFNFPLETTLTMDQVYVQANAHLNKVRIKKALGNLFPYDLEQGKMDLKVDKTHLEATGKAHLSGAPVSLIWKQKFTDQVKDWRTQYKLEASVTSDTMQKFGYQGFFTGPIKVNLDFTEDDNKSSKLNVDADFTLAELHLPGFLGVNKHGDAGKLKIQALFRDSKLQQIQHLSMTGDNLQMNAKVTYDAKNQRLISFESNDLKLGQTELSVKMKEGKDHHYYCDVTGKRLDVKALLDYFKATTPQSKWNQPLHIILSVDTALFEHNKSLSPFQLTCTLNNKGLNNLYINASIPSYRNVPGYLNLVLEPHENEKTLKLDSNNAGEVLSLLGMTGSVHQGKISIQARQKEGSFWAGKIKMKHFYVTNAPVVTQLLSLASPFGLFDAVTGKPITFNKFRAQFKYNEKEILLRNGRGGGKSIGFTMDGKIDQTKQQIDFHGTILPYNAFNMFLVKIPLVGQLLGGKGGGLLGINYGLSGNIDSPHASVNPLSALTPGILREIFSSHSTDDFDPEVEDNDDEDAFFNSADDDNDNFLELENEKKSG